MGVNLLNHLKELSNFLKNCPNEVSLLDNFINGISKVLKSDIIFIDTKGNLIKEINNQLISLGIKNDLTDEVRVEAQLISQLSNVNEKKINITLDNLSTNIIDKDILKNFYGIFLPIFISNEKLGILIIYKKDEKYEDELEVISEYISSVFGVLSNNIKNIKSAEEEREISTVKSSIDTLSYSELEAIISIFEELDGQEGLLVASKIADKAGITRSVIVNALRKFESAGIIESRSLGMKGTYIKVLNKYLLPEINKFKK